ncbi:MAG: hypothetical protein ACJ8AT_33355 [Hyalangium sp.]|uniref:hypothetical protein n=1 Tax=Hyalangium sp. TaxID=2028555 RepID=UPI0038998C63
MKKKVEVIEEQVLRDCLASGGSVALARVGRLEPVYQGTRGAKVFIHLEVEQQLHGQLPREVRYWVYGSPELVQLPPQLIIAVRPPYAGTQEVQMMSAVEVPQGMEAESVQAHQQALAKLGKSPAPSGR